MFVAFQI